MITLTQKTTFNKKEFEIGPDSLITRQYKLFNRYFEAEIPFEELHLKRIKRYSTFELGILAFAGLFALFFFVLLISKLQSASTKADWSIIITFGAITSFFLFFFYYTKRDLIVIPSDEISIAMYQSLPSKEEVNEFLNELKTRSSIYTRNKYFILTKELDLDTRNRYLFFLFDRGFIDQEEFEESSNLII